MSTKKNQRILMLLENNPYCRDIRVKREAQSLVASGYTVSVICPRSSQRRKANPEADGVQVYEFPAPPEGANAFGYFVEYGLALVWMFFLSLWVLLRTGFDVIHAHNPPDILVLIALPYKIFGKKFVFDHHDLSPELFAVRFQDADDHKILRILKRFERLSCRVADHVIVTNGSFQEIDVRRSGIKLEATTIVRNGPSDAMCPVSPEPNLRNRAGLILGYVGTLAPQDGVDYLIRAVHHIVYIMGVRDVCCLIIGDGDSLPSLKTLAAELDIEEYIVFTGWVSHDEVSKYLSNADVCVDPDPSNALNDSSTMIKIMEYMALSKPIVAFDLPEHRVSAGEAALYARKNDIEDMARLIVELGRDSDRCREMGVLGRRRITSELAWKYQARELLGVYERL